MSVLRMILGASFARFVEPVNKFIAAAGGCRKFQIYIRDLLAN